MGQSVRQQLAAFYDRSGYARLQRQARLAEGSKRYKKGDEVRLVAHSEDELAAIRELLDKAGFKGGRPFAKHSRWVQPVYGRQQVVRFLDLIGREVPPGNHENPPS